MTHSFPTRRSSDLLSRRLSSFDKETLDFLMTPGDQSMLGQIGREIDRLNQLNIPGILQRQAQTGAIVRDLVMRKDTAAIDTLVQRARSEAHTSELQSLMRISYAVFCLNKKN